MARRVAAPRGGVPFLHEKQIEAEAELLLGEYAEKFGDQKPHTPSRG